MCWKIFVFTILIFYIVTRCQTERRIISGKRTLTEKGYMVYLTRSDKSDNVLYNTWLCGGSIISPHHILTSAACLEDVTNLYAIAGYRKYVPSQLLDEDECTRRMKRRVVKTCVPNSYKLNRSDPAMWASKDIGVAIVGEPYNFSDTAFRIFCDYIPKAIQLSFRVDFPLVGTDVVTFGWGHSVGLRQVGDDGDYNAKYLYEASTVIKSFDLCRKKFQGLDGVLMNSLYCCAGNGTLDGNGDNLAFKYASRANSCPNQFRRQSISYECGTIYQFETRRNGNMSSNFTRKILYRKKKLSHKPHKIRQPATKPRTFSRNRSSNFRRAPMRDPGICQNDHGGPLVAWQGSEERLVGVALGSLVDKDFTCIPPYLFVAIKCHSRFLLCVLAYSDTTRRKCDEMETEDGVKLHEVTVPWDDHTPDSGSTHPSDLPVKDSDITTIEKITPNSNLTSPEHVMDFNRTSTESNRYINETIDSISKLYTILVTPHQIKNDSQINKV